jgi:hypothetical protein
MRRYIVIGMTAAWLAAVALTVGCAASSVAPVPGPSEDMPAETTVTAVFFSTGRTLVEEPRVIDASRPYEAALEELFEALPELEQNKDIAIVQPASGPRSVVFKDGLITLDWDRNVLDFEAEDSEERLAFAAILMTLGEFPEVKKVQFTVEGKTEGTIDDKDIRSFWGSISLIGQPWDVLRQPPKPSELATETVIMTESPEAVGR